MYRAEDEEAGKAALTTLRIYIRKAISFTQNSLTLPLTCKQQIKEIILRVTWVICAIGWLNVEFS